MSGLRSFFCSHMTRRTSSSAGSPNVRDFSIFGQKLTKSLDGWMDFLSRRLNFYCKLEKCVLFSTTARRRRTATLHRLPPILALIQVMKIHETFVLNVSAMIRAGDALFHRVFGRHPRSHVGFFRGPSCKTRFYLSCLVRGAT